MPQAPIHAGGPQYAPPLLRAASPSSSIGTEYEEDGTNEEENALPEDAFHRLMEERMFFDLPLRPEEDANKDILLRPPHDQAEERAMHQQTMAYLRARVRQLEEDELFEQTMLRGPQVAEEHLPTSNDLDVIMRSLMTPVQPAQPPVEQVDLATSHWMQQNGDGGIASSSTTAENRAAKGKGRSRRG